MHTRCSSRGCGASQGDDWPSIHPSDERTQEGVALAPDNGARCMNLYVDPSEFREVIEKAVEVTVRRMRDESPKDADGRILLTKAEAAEALGVSPATVDRLRKAGLPAVKLDSLVLFRPEALRSWAAANETSVGNGG